MSIFTRIWAVASLLALTSGVATAQQRAIEKLPIPPFYYDSAAELLILDGELERYATHRQDKRARLGLFISSPSAESRQYTGSPESALRGAASTFIVNSPFDDVDNNPGDGTCWTGFSLQGDTAVKECTLRAALMESNATGGADLISIELNLVNRNKGGTDSGYNADDDTWVIAVDLGGQGPLPAISRANVVLTGLTQERGFLFEEDARCGELTAGEQHLLKVAIDGSLLTGFDDGVVIQAGDVVVTGLAITGFPNRGIFVEGANSAISCSHIGTDPEGFSINDGNLVGIAVGDDISSTLIENSLISGNLASGIVINGTATTLRSTLVGTTASGQSAIPNAAFGVNLGPVSKQADIGEPTFGNLISGNARYGIRMDGIGHTVEANLVGTNLVGQAALPNAEYGVYVAGSLALIGGSSPSRRNIISGNDGKGIGVTGTACAIEGNYIGLDVDGLDPIPNTEEGVSSFGGRDLRIGGGPTATRNVISGNQRDGILLDGAEQAVFGNYVGLTMDGLNVAPNGRNGISILESADDVTVADGNVVSANDRNGISIAGSNVVIQNNIVGLAANGQASRPNEFDGIIITSSASTVAIGGAGGADGNTLSGNRKNGIAVKSPGHTISGNRIGLSADGSTPNPNIENGILVETSNTLIGGTTAGAANLIAGNLKNGITVSNTSGPNVRNAILGNSIFDNQGLGIDLAPSSGGNGVTDNDAGDGDSGANDRQNFPIVAPVVISETTTNIDFTLSSRNNRSYRIQLFLDPSPEETHGEGRNLLGSATITTDGSGFHAGSIGVASGSLANGAFVTATATSIEGGLNASTSEFSEAVAISSGSGLLVQAKLSLQGAFGASGMRTSLLEGGLLPTIQPFGAAQFDGTAMDYDGPETVSTFPSGTVDWVILELRSGSPEAIPLARRAALLHADGTVMELDGSASVLMPGAAPGDYYISIKTRSHLAVVSQQAVTLLP